MQLPPPRPYPAAARLGLGDLRWWPGLALPGLDRRADVTVWLPPGYDEDTARYPVIYLHDGATLYDPAACVAGSTWRAHEALAAAAAAGLPAVAVGVPCSADGRHLEYTPFPHPALGGGRGDRYVSFLADHLKPAVDAALRTRAEARHTVVAGSSLGGVISLHAWSTRNDVFGAAGCLSPAFWWSPEQLPPVAAALAAGQLGGRVYVDVGGREDPQDPPTQRAYVTDTEALVSELRRAGVPVRYLYDSTAEHHETAWAERFPAALRWLLSG
ncbi:alpha/beta hydrolase [Ornithinicoccus halotolerans]|uniref:alpha/beta hydrolase n=1 Tax=Ornithinicoccus halotolerans TaxID=1748220 RepID=UPI001885F894|nr:alpha/beta hydrolase-fold protein [Ornithinicoccus halotolerans]